MSASSLSPPPPPAPGRIPSSSQSQSLPSLLRLRSTLPLRSPCAGAPYVHLPPSCHFRPSLSLRLAGPSSPRLGLLPRPLVASPHVGSITSLDVDNGCEGRFLLAGGRDGTVSAYDLSSFGSDWAVGGGVAAAEAEAEAVGANGGRGVDPRTRAAKLRRHGPVARSRREAAGARPRPIGGLGEDGDDQDDDPNRVPTGHRHSVSSARWYPVDTGAFVSADAGGTVLVWDTNSFLPVSSFRVSHTGGLGARCMDLPNRWNSGSHALLAVGCGSIGTASDLGMDLYRRVDAPDDRVVRLCDLRSGSASHELVGHGPRGGVNAVAWSPTDAFALASGGDDGTVRLWDVRRSGSGSCLGMLNREDDDEEEEGDVGGGGASGEDGGEGRRGGGRTGGAGRKRRRMTKGIAPSDYSRVQSSDRGAPVQSHGGPVTALSYSPDGWYLVSAGLDGRVRLWDLRPSGGRRNRGSSASSSVVVGRPLRTAFLGPSDERPLPVDSKSRNVALAVSQPGSRRTAALWVGAGGRSGDVLAYELHGPGGRPSRVLSGHLDGVTSVAVREAEGTVFTGGRDGMILGWGRRSVDDDDDVDDEARREEDATYAFFARTRGRRRRRPGGARWGEKKVDVDCW